MTPNLGNPKNENVKKNMKMKREKKVEKKCEKKIFDPKIGDPDSPLPLKDEKVKKILK